MKFLYRKFLTALLFLFFAFIAKAVSDTTLTIRQVFNWKAGDTLVYDYFEVIYFPQPPYGSGTVHQHSKNGFTVEAREDFQDTIIYHLRWKNGFADTLTLTNLDTPVTKIGYSVFYTVLGGCEELPLMPTRDSSWSNYVFDSWPITAPIDTLASLLISYPQFETGWDISYTQSVGLRYADFGAQEYWPGGSMGYSGGCGIKLVYYKSDSLTWIDPDYYLGISEQTPSPAFRLYPNPATDQLTITSENQAPVDVFINDMLGNCMLTHKNFSPNLGLIKDFFLPSGYYLLKLTDQHGVSSSKGFIIAR